jgi:hypothetical protein
MSGIPDDYHMLIRQKLVEFIRSQKAPRLKERPRGIAAAQYNKRALLEGGGDDRGFDGADEALAEHGAALHAGRPGGQPVASLLLRQLPSDRNFFDRIGLEGKIEFPQIGRAHV